MQDGKYQYTNESWLPAHELCFSLAVRIMQAQADLAFAECFLDQHGTLFPYLGLAMNYGYEIHVTDHIITPEESMERNTHEVPEKIIYAMHSKFRPWEVLAPQWHSWYKYILSNGTQKFDGLFLKILLDRIDTQNRERFDIQHD
jgi:predicted kinase